MLLLSLRVLSPRQPGKCVCVCMCVHWGFPDGSDRKQSACYAGDLGSNPGSGGSLGEGNGYPLQTARRNTNNLRYVDDTTLTAESKEELKSLLMKMKEESEKGGLKLNIQKMKIMAFSPITSWQIDGEIMETVTDYFLGLQNHCRW